MQGHGQFHHAEAGAEVPAGAAHGVEQVGAQFVHHLLKVRFGQPPQVRRRAYAVQQRRVGAGQRNVDNVFCIDWEPESVGVGLARGGIITILGARRQ